MKKVIYVVAAIIVLAVAWYLLSPLFRDVELNETSPVIGDNFESMDQATREQFEGAVEEMEDVVVEKVEPMPSQSPQVIAQGDFVARAHGVEGRAILIDTGDEQIVRFEDFDTINGPGLHIYLSSDLSDDDYIDLGSIRGTKGNINYTLPAGTDIEKYNNVLVWCVPFKVLFSYAELK